MSLPPWISPEATHFVKQKSTFERKNIKKLNASTVFNFII